MIPYLDAIRHSLRTQPEPARTVLAETVVPGLLRSLHEQGLQVSVSRSLHDIEQFLIRQPDKRWFHLYDPECQPDASIADTAICFLTTADEIVGSICCRHLWLEGSLGEGMQGLSLFYPDPKMRQPGEVVLVTADRAYEIKACHVAFMCGGYVKKDCRGSGVYDGLSRLCRILALTEWRWSHLVSLVEKELARKIGFDTYGHGGAFGSVHHRIADRCPMDQTYLLMVSDRAHMRRVLTRREAGDLNWPLLEPTEDDIEAARITA